jgi:hypothetical protein
MMKNGVMKKITLLGILTLLAMLPLLSSCTTPVLRKDLLESGTTNPLLSDLLQSPDTWRNQLFILGGTIVSNRYTEEGSLIEAM